MVGWSSACRGHGRLGRLGRLVGVGLEGVGWERVGEGR